MEVLKLKKVKAALLALSFGAISLGANASEIVCVNGDELLKVSQFAQELKKEVEQKREEIISQYQQKAQKILERLKSLQQELSSGLLSDEAKKKKQREYMQLQAQLQTLQMETQQQLQQYLSQTLKKLDQITKAALKVLAKTENFKVAADCKSLLYYDPSVDITKQVAKILDQLARQAKQQDQETK